MTLKVLVVEDHIATLELMSEVISSLGVEVRPVSDSQRAGTLINQEKFDGIFLDLMMPALDGFELARQIRQSSWNQRTPIVIVTGKEDKGTIAQAFAAGGNFFLQKPLNKRKLIQLLNSTRGSMLDERRRFKRISLRSQVKCQIDSRTFTGMSSNLSQDGILFDSEGLLTPGNVVRLSFSLPKQSRPVETEGIVVRVDQKRRVGIRFGRLSDDDRQRIRTLIASEAETA